MQNLFENSVKYISDMVNILSKFSVKNIKILCSSNLLILFKFCQLMLKTVHKELQREILTYIVNNSIKNMKELERKKPCKNLCSNRICLVTEANVDIGSLKFHLQFQNKCLCHKLTKFEHNQIRTRWNVQPLVKKESSVFDKVSTPFWKIFLSLKQLFDEKY